MFSEYTERLSAGIDEQQMTGLIPRFLSKLSEREAKIIKLRFGFEGCPDGQSLGEIGTVFGCGRERIRQIELKALRKMQAEARRLFPEDPPCRCDWHQRIASQSREPINTSTGLPWTDIDRATLFMGRAIRWCPTHSLKCFLMATREVMRSQPGLCRLFTLLAPLFDDAPCIGSFLIMTSLGIPCPEFWTPARVTTYLTPRRKLNFLSLEIVHKAEHEERQTAEPQEPPK